MFSHQHSHPAASAMHAHPESQLMPQSSTPHSTAISSSDPSVPSGPNLEAETLIGGDPSPLLSLDTKTFRLVAPAGGSVYWRAQADPRVIRWALGGPVSGLQNLYCDNARRRRPPADQDPSGPLSVERVECARSADA